MNNKHIKVLWVEDDPDDVYLLKKMFTDKNMVGFELTHVNNFSDTVQYLIKENFDVILLDLGLPDSNGIDTFVKLYDQFMEVPIVILTVLEDESIAADVVRRGAQDYLVKSQVDANLIARTIRYAIERNRMKMALYNLALIDELTGLYNRRGFLTVAKQYLKSAERTKSELLVVYIDLDGMKRINDTFGHDEGDKALVNVAVILKETFRYSDVVARIGGDEFVILARDTSSEYDEIINTRLQEKLNIHNEQKNCLYKLSLSIGIVHSNVDKSVSIEELLSEADKVLYKDKQRKKTTT